VDIRFVRLATTFVALIGGASLSLPCAALNVTVTAANTNAVETGTRPPAPTPVDLSSPNLGLRDVLSVLNANKAHAGTSIDSLNIVLSAGMYRLASPLVITLDPTWSSTPITITGPATGGRAILSGGRVVTGFAPVRDTSVLARLPAGARGNVLVADLRQNGITDLGVFQRHGYQLAITPAPLELFYRDQPMTLARWPATGFATIATLPNGPNGLTFTIAGAPVSDWQNEPDLHAMGYWARDWADATLPVAAVDASSGQVTLSSPAPTYGMKVGQRVFIENALSALAHPGQYYVDRANALVYFWPPTGLVDGDVQVSVVDSLLVANNATNLTVSNLMFDVARGDGIQLLGGGNDEVDHVILRNLGNRGAVSSAGSSGFRFVTIENTGEGGLVIYGGDRATLAPGNAFVEDSTIDNFARRTRAYRPGISISGAGDRALRNTIHDGPHAAIIFTGNNHEIAGNEIYRMVTETADSGAIYTGRDWTMRGTIIENNFIHDIGSASQPQATMGVYLDDEACGITIRRNVFSSVNQAVFIGGGRDNLVEDNLFANSSPAVSVDSRGLSWQKPVVDDPNGVFRTGLRTVHYDVPPYSVRYPALARILSDMPGAPLGDMIHRNVFIGGSTTVSTDSGAAQYVVVETSFGASDVVFTTSMPDSARTTFSQLQLSPSSPAIAQGFQTSLFGQPAQ
jgi:Right handed beta helix region